MGHPGVWIALQKKWLKAREYFVQNQDTEIKKDPEDWFSRDWPSPVSYMRNELQVWVRLKVRTGIRSHSYYLAVFERFASEAESGPFRGGSPVGRNGPRRSAYRDEKYSMLVDVVQIAEKSEPVPSVVRLYLLKDFPRVMEGSGADIWQKAFMAQVPPSSWRTVENGKLGLGVGISDQLIGEMIQGRSQVVDAVADNCAPSGVDGRMILKPVDVLQAIGLDVGDYDIALVWKPTPNLLVEKIGMEQGSLYFDLDAVERSFLPPPLALHGT